MVFLYNVYGKPNATTVRIRLQGLEPEADYTETETGCVLSGSALMQVGIPLDNRSDMNAQVHVFRK